MKRSDLAMGTTGRRIIGHRVVSVDRIDDLREGDNLQHISSDCVYIVRRAEDGQVVATHTTNIVNTAEWARIELTYAEPSQGGHEPPSIHMDMEDRARAFRELARATGSPVVVAGQK